MADVPEYKRGNRIEPGAPTQGFEQAYSNVGAATHEIGTFGAQLAKNAAIEQATIDGVKAGQTPGRKLIPAFTDSDKAFVHAYKQEEYNTVARDADQYLSKSYFEVAKNPTTEGLALYQKNAVAQIDKLSTLVSEENRPKLKRDLTASYESKFYQLASSLENKNNKNMKINFNLNVDKASRDIQTFTATGENEKAKSALQENIDYINSQIGTEAVPTKEAAEVLIENQRKLYSVSEVQADLVEAQAEQRDPEFWAERAQLPPTPDNLETNAILYKQQQMYNNMIGMQSSIARNEGIEKALTGELTDSARLDYESKMDAMDKSKFQLDVARINLRGIEDTQKIQYVKQNADNGVALATVSGDILDKVLDQDIKTFSRLQGRPPSMQELGAMARNYEAPIPSFNKQLGAMINSRDGRKSIEGAAIYDSLSTTHPRAVDGISKEDESRAALINSAIDAGENPGEAIDFVNNKLDSLRKTDIDQRKDAFKEKLRLLDLNKPSFQESLVSKEMGYNKELIPSGLYKDYMKNLENYYVLTNDFNESKNLAKKAINRVYAKTTINGEEQVMWLAPNKVLPMGDNEVFLKNLLVNKCEKIFEAQKALFDDSQSGASYYYKLDADEVKPDKNMVFEPRVNKAIPIIKISSDGKEERGSIYISSDNVTSLPADGQYPSYGMFFLSKGKRVPYPIYSPNNIGNMERFSVTDEDVSKANSIRANRDQAMYNRALYFKNAKELATKVREKIGEPDNDTP